MRRETGYGVEFAQGRLGPAQIGDEPGQLGRVLAVVSEIVAVQQAQLARQQVEVAPAQDGDDWLVAFEGELPFLAHVVGEGRLWSGNVDKPVDLLVDGVLDLL